MTPRADPSRIVGDPYKAAVSRPVAANLREWRVNRPVAILAVMYPDQALINRWRGAAPFWEKHCEIIRLMFAPVTQALIEDGLIGRRHAVLDIATGPGEPALDVAALVGPEGKVVGIRSEEHTSELQS